MDPTQQQGAGMLPPDNEYVKNREEFDPMFYLIGLGLFLIFFCFFNKDKKPVKSPEEKGQHDPKNTFFTLDELKAYNGKGPSGKTYIACFEQVFDVTDSPHYQDGGSYASFAGRDITVACAHHSTEEKYLSIPYEKLSTQLTFD